ncbi:OprO/OprP family phosphate-selective porin [Caulobacter sp. RHG1]|uniref:OprO/OprP family phosphate-selective porin n=1 Tax=Caulobacter sp. (strain RHG1) TaxID=2545762 RepID=UPI001551B147|nr:porin [Caulobacter sp. RHG1]NQE63679.1 Phosphate/pyrophosphate-specific outer membrane porin OprP/OprO [Caulobacter sp. RHG1]
MRYEVAVRPSLPTLFSAAALGLSSSPAMAQALSADEAAALRAEIATLKAQLQRMEQKLDAASAAPQPVAPVAPPAEPATEIAWKGSPQFASEGRTFKAKGRIQADAGYVSHPRGASDRGLGYAAEMRRIRLGGEGSLSKAFGYKLELELSDNAVDLVDTFVTWKSGPWELALGNQNQFQALDELTGDTTGATMERAAFTDAFNFERRLGLAAQYEKADWILQAGLFADDIDALADSADGPDGGDENNSYGFDGRVVYAPKLGQTQLHLAASAHWRDLKRLREAGARYRQRPYLHTSNSRLIDTGVLDVRDEAHYGVEAAFVRGRWHGAAEAHWLESDLAIGPTPRFFGGYAELGYFFTGETRGYGGGIFERTKTARPLGSGGLGALQASLRYDYLDMNDRGVVGGRQDAWIAALIWQPIDYLRFNLNHGWLSYGDAAPLANGDRSYRVRTTGARMELDF